MFDCNQLINSFYDDCVIPNNDLKSRLRDFRNINLRRVQEGTEKLEEETGIKLPKYIDDIGQGSMAMHTINQSQHDDDHDIDHALIYDASDIDSSPKKAKEFVASVINKASGNFKTPPEARTNAVTIWYDNGYHVDFAIYRRSKDHFGQVTLEHAGSKWTARDPSAITNWFNLENVKHSPASSTSFGKLVVKSGQLRRIVRLIKFWSKSRSRWSLPSGLVLSTLVVENYKPDDYRDDIAFYNTLCAIRDRLGNYQGINNPTDQTNPLLGKELHRKQVESLLKKLERWTIKLEELQNSYVDEKKAKNIWGVFFKNSWWSQKPKKLKKSDVGISNSDILSVSVTVRDKSGRKKFNYNPIGNITIPKKMRIQFIANTKIGPPYEITWEVHNSGEEAEWNDEDNPRGGFVDEADMHICNETSAYRGNHQMICCLFKNGELIEKKFLEVRIR